MNKSDYIGLNQQERVIKYLQEEGPLTRLSALQNLGIFELPARITELADDRIHKNRVKVQNQFGEDISVMEYSIL